MKKIISLVLCLMMVLSFAAPVFADESAAAAATYDLTIDSAIPDHTYEAWQIFSGDLETVTGADNKTYQVLTNIKWGAAIKGEGYDNSAAVISAIAAEAAKTDAPASIKALADITDPSKLAEAIADNFQTNLSNNPELELLSRILEKCFVAGKYTATDDYTDGKYEMTDLPAGYYLIKDQDNSLAGDNASYTKFILRVLKDETVVPKADTPKVNKTINDTLGGTYTEHEDFDINDYAYYKWEGTLPSNLHSYKTYFYAFHDTLKHAGLTFVRIEQVYLEGHDGDVVKMFYDVSADENKVITAPGTHTLVEGMELTVGEMDAEGHTKIDLTIADLFKLYDKENILANQKFIVKYTVRINRDAVIEESMDNAVSLEFSNDPNWEDDGDPTTPPPPPTGETPEDEAHAFTFGLKVSKTDGDTKVPLEGAEFVLYYQGTENDHVVNYYAQVITEEMIAAGAVINGKKVEQKDLGVVYGWTTEREEASILDTDAAGMIAIKGLDEDIYFLEETLAPAGYNKLEKPIQFEIDPVYNDKGELQKVIYKIGTQEVSSNVIPVENFTGSTLPSTGGMGTTLFYVFGGIMVLAAVVLLVTKKRMAA